MYFVAKNISGHKLLGLKLSNPYFFYDNCLRQNCLVYGNVISWCTLVPCPNVGQASTNRDLRLYPGEGMFSCIVTNLYLSVI